MPRGFSGIKDKVDLQRQESERRQNQRFDGPPPLYFGIKDGQSATVRFLEQDEDIAYAETHEIPVEGRAWGITIPCLDQDATGKECPGCNRGLDRKFKGYINLIWFNGPVWKRDENHRLVKENGQKVAENYKDQVAIWTSGIRLFEKLQALNEKYKGLTSRRFEVKRIGTQLPRYEIMPEDAAEFSKEEEELRQGKYDLAPYVTAGSKEDFLFKLGELDSPKQNGNDPLEEAKSRNPFELDNN